MLAPSSRRLRWYQIRWPHEVTVDQLDAVLRSLNGASTPRIRHCLTMLAVAQAGTVSHYIAVPDTKATVLTSQLDAAIPGIALQPLDDPPATPVNRAWRCWASSRTLPLDAKHPTTIARGMLAALATVGRDETLAVRWTLGRVRRPTSPRAGNRRHSEIAAGLGTGFADLLASPTAPGDPPAAVAHKQGQPGWRACLHLGVGADGRRRQRQLLGHLAGSVRAAQGPGVQLGFRPTRRAQLDTGRVPHVRNLTINVDELVGLAAWPIGQTLTLPVAAQPNRLLERSAAATSSRIVAQATYPGDDGPLTLSARDGLQHLHVIGPTGTGKSTLLLNLICQDMDAGRSVVVIDPRGDLVADVAARVPDDRVDDVVIIDPMDSAPVGINPLSTPGLPSHLKAEHILTIFKSIYAESWGPRTQDILTAGLLTLAENPQMSLAGLPLLFTNETFRRNAVAGIDDPLALDLFWQWFYDLSTAERADAIAPVMNKLRAFLLRKHLRRIIGQANPRFDLRDLFLRRRILLVNLAVGALGPEASALLGALLVSQLWQTVLGRAAVAPERRHPVMVFLDEFQSYLALPTDLGDVLAQARGLGVGLTLAHQHLAQLPAPIKAATLANARSRVVFASQYDDAQVLVRDDVRLTPADVRGLGRYAVYVSLITAGQTTPYASGQTFPPPPALRNGDEIRQLSRHQWGVPASAVDAQLEALVRDGQPPATPAPSGTSTFIEGPRPGTEPG